MIEFFIVIKEEAESDLKEIFNYYELKQVGLGEDFLNKFEISLQKVKLNPFHTFKISYNFRRAVTPKFPYNVYYSVVENAIIIFAVLHQSRKPLDLFKTFE